MASWRGESGTHYQFGEHQLPHNPPDRTGNYIFAKRHPNGYWLAV